MRARPPGFTLIEILVALIVLTVALGAFLQLFSTGMRATTAAEARTLAVLLAQSRLAALGIETPLEAGVFEGAYDQRFRWTAEIAPLEDAGASPDDSDVAVYRVTVTVSWGEAPGGGSVTLETARVSFAGDARGGQS